jgi:ribA/ribD-fused uncharacterized protein
MIDRFKGEYRWLSNFWSVAVIVDGERYESVEAGYQAAKTLDEKVRERIRRLPTAADAKRFGRRIGKSIPFRPAWNDNFKVRLMRDLLHQKFTDRDLRQRLITTGDQMLTESGNWHDLFWGRCGCPKCGGCGRNMLGVLLMEIRAACRAQDASGISAANWRLDDAA